MAKANYSKEVMPATSLIKALWQEQGFNTADDPLFVPYPMEDVQILIRLQRRGFPISLLMSADSKDYRIIFTTQYLQYRIAKIRKLVALRHAPQLPLIPPDDDLGLDLVCASCLKPYATAEQAAACCGGGV